MTVLPRKGQRTFGGGGSFLNLDPGSGEMGV